MKILAVNGSPRGAKGNTEQLLQKFLQGAQAAGAETETVYLKDKKINHCRGCYACWGKTPGVCVHKDDMPELLEKVIKAEIIVYATPLYVYTVSGLMKDFMDRRLPLALPQIIKYGDRYAHPRRYEETKHKTVLISNCGFPGRQYFLGMMESFRIFCSGPHNQLAGAILCSAGALLTMPPARDMVQWYLDACEKAGREVVLQGSISPATQAVLDQELITDVDQYMNGANDHWEHVLSGQLGFEPLD